MIYEIDSSDKSLKKYSKMELTKNTARAAQIAG